MSKLARELQKTIASLQKEREKVIANLDRRISLLHAALRGEQEAKNGTTSGSNQPERRDVPQPVEQGQWNGDTDFVRNAISRSAKAGISAAAIKEAARTFGLTPTRKFPYKILSRLKKSGKIYFRDGLYYLFQRKGTTRIPGKKRRQG